MLIFAFVAALAAPNEPLAGYLRFAVRADLEHNVAIGTGAENAVAWFKAAAKNDRKIRTSITGCSKGSITYRCSFSLIREGGDVRFEGQLSPAILKCTALFKRFTDEEGETWGVTHAKAKPTGGHTRTSMRCRSVSDRLR